MNVVDSSGWLEYLSKGPNARYFAEPLFKPDELIVPIISVYEVFKRTLRERGAVYAFEVAGFMYQGEVVPLSGVIALDAAYLSTRLALPMADSIILATASAHGATLWTQDKDFAAIEGVKYIAKVH
jgi:predicted nucleic acid-binding protein